VSGTITPSSCDENVISQGIVYSTSQLPIIDDNVSEFSLSSYEIEIDGLNPGTTYYVRPFLTNNDGEFYGNQIQVSTLTPEVGFTDATIENSFQTVTLSTNYEFTEAQEFEIFTKGFEIEGQNIESNAEGTFISVTVEDLELNSSITYRPYVNTEYGMFYGEQGTFNTDDPSSNIGTFIISDVSFNGATVNASYVNNYDGSDITSEVGVILTTNPDFSSATRYLGDRTGQSFSVELTNLDVNTTYYAKVYVENEYGTYTSDVKEINTLNPGYNFVTLEFSEVEYSDVRLTSNFNQIQGELLPVIEKGFYISQLQSDLETKKYVSGSGVNIIEIEATALNSGDLYYFQAYVENQYGVFTSNISSFTTNSAAPLITATQVIPGLDFVDISFSLEFKPNTTNSSLVLEYFSSDGSETGTINLDTEQLVQDLRIDNLTPKTEYDYSITLTNQYGTYKTDFTPFRTLDDTPGLNLEVSQTGDNQVTINADVTPSTNDLNITRVYLEYFNVESGVTSIELDPSLLTYNIVLDDLAQGPGYTFTIYVFNTYNSFERSSFYTLPVTYAIGDRMFGGTIVEIDQTGYHGYVIADLAYSTNLQWSTNYYNFNRYIEGDENGEENTEVVIAYYESNAGTAPAFEYCVNVIIEGYDDWYLPATNELVKGGRLLLDLGVDIYGGGTEYWTSSEAPSSFNGERAIKNTGLGRITYEDKQATVTVIPFRRF
jgi:hypothetical protein